MDEAADQPILAIDLGGTQIRAAHVSQDASVAFRRAVGTDANEGVDAVVGRICRVATEVRDAANEARLGDPIAVGISAPGPLDPWRGLVIGAPNLPGWSEVPLASLVEQRLALPTFLERDTNVALMAEWRFGAARGADDAIYMTVSTGIGGGIVIGGRPLQGKDNTAGEIGHITVEIDGPLCGDGMPGHVEAIGSGTAIAREGRRLLEEGAAPGLAGLVAEPADVSAKEVSQAADEGDAACQAVLDRAWTAVGVLCASLVIALNPEVIVVGGSIAEHRPELLVRIRQEIDRRAFPRPAQRVRIVLAALGDDVSLIGSLPIITARFHDPAYRLARPVTPTA